MGARRTSDWSNLGGHWSNDDQSKVVPIGVPGRSRKDTGAPINPWSTAGWDGRTHISLDDPRKKEMRLTPGRAIANLAGDEVRFAGRRFAGMSFVRLGTAFLLALSAVLAIFLFILLLS